MDFISAVKHVLGHYATFNGRASRSEYWWWVLFTVLVSIVANIIDAVLGTRTGSGTGLVGGLISLAFLLPGIAVAARRLHDVNRSGWWQLISITIIGLIPLLIWLCRRGDVTPNAYGPDPLGALGPAGAIAG